MAWDEIPCLHSSISCCNAHGMKPECLAEQEARFIIFRFGCQFSFCTNNNSEYHYSRHLLLSFRARCTIKCCCADKEPHAPLLTTRLIDKFNASSYRFNSRYRSRHFGFMSSINWIFPCAPPLFDPLFKGDGIGDVIVLLVPNELFDVVFAGMARHQFLIVLMDAPADVVRHADIERTARTGCKDVEPSRSFVHFIIIGSGTCHLEGSLPVRSRVCIAAFHAAMRTG